MLVMLLAGLIDSTQAGSQALENMKLNAQILLGILADRLDQALSLGHGLVGIVV